jgi:hypothetical protein
MESIYVSRSIKNSEEIYNWFKEQGILNMTNKDDLHITQVYSTKPVDVDTLTLDKNDIIINPKDSLFIMETFDNNECLVMICNNDIMQKRFDYFKDKKCSWDFPQYNCHITISNHFSENKIELKNIKPFPQKIILGPEILESLDVEYNNCFSI